MPHSPHLNLSRYVPGLLTFLSNKLSSGASTCYRKRFGVGVVEWRMLSMLAVENAISPNRISQVIGLDKSAVSRALQHLANAGYVTIETDVQDGRRNTVSLSVEGEALHDQIFAVAIEREKRLLASLSPPEIDTLVNLLGRLHAQVGYVNEYEPENDR
jgi:DNA-binding MarR family transcriptional regulator